MTGHCFWLRESEQKKKSGRDIGQDSIFAAEFCGIFGNINEVYEVVRVRGVRRTVRVAHLLAISVIRGDQGLAVEFEKS